LRLDSLSPMFQKILSQILAFRDARDWGQFHNSKDLALALSIESAELNECFLWKSATDYNREKLSEELAVSDIVSFQPFSPQAILIILI
jgi:hypothetical protein